MHNPDSQRTSSQQSLSRRQFLQTTAVGVGAALLAACAPMTPAESDGANPPAAANVTLITTGWPVTPPPSAEDLEADPARAGYAQALNAWMSENPGVTIEQVEVNIWDQQAITTAIAGGTAPTFLYALTVGGWTLAGAQAAFKQGLIADITPFIGEFNLRSKLADAAGQIFETHGNVDGQTYYYPIDAGYNGGVWYRRDLVNELGLQEPTVNWTWADFHNLVIGLTSEEEGRFGFGAPAWYAGSYLSGHGFDVFSEEPAPDTGWNWQKDFGDPRWAELAAEYRALVFDHKAIFSDAAVGGTADYATAFTEGRLAMTTQNILGAFGSAAQETSVAALAVRLGKSYEEVMGFAPLPSGDGYVENGLYLGGVSYSPDATPEELHAAVSLTDWMFLGEGWLIQKRGQYEATQDLQAVFNYPFPIDGVREYDGVPGTFADAWGAKTLADLEAMAALPIAPERALYFPAEENPGPSNEAIDDLWSTLTYVADGVDVNAALLTAAETWNAQAGGFSSSISDDVFIAGAKEYYAALDAYWASASPSFYEQRYTPWYNANVAQALG